MIRIKTQVRNAIQFHKKSPNKYEILNVEITYYPYIILVIYQQSSQMISSRFISSDPYPSYNVHQTHWSLYINMHIYVVIHLLVLTLSFSSISDPLSSSSLTVSTWPLWAAIIRAVTPAYCYDNNDDDWMRPISVLEDK